MDNTFGPFEFHNNNLDSGSAQKPDLDPTPAIVPPGVEYAGFSLEDANPPTDVIVTVPEIHQPGLEGVSPSTEPSGPAEIITAIIPNLTGGARQVVSKYFQQSVDIAGSTGSSQPSGPEASQPEGGNHASGLGAETSLAEDPNTTVTGNIVTEQGTELPLTVELGETIADLVASGKTEFAKTLAEDIRSSGDPDQADTDNKFIVTIEETGLFTDPVAGMVDATLPLRGKPTAPASESPAHEIPENRRGNATESSHTSSDETANKQLDSTPERLGVTRAEGAQKPGWRGIHDRYAPQDPEALQLISDYLGGSPETVMQVLDSFGFSPRQALGAWSIREGVRPSLGSRIAEAFDNVQRQDQAPSDQ